LRWKHQNCLRRLRFDGAGLLRRRVPRTEKAALRRRCSGGAAETAASGAGGRRGRGGYIGGGYIGGGYIGGGCKCAAERASH